MDPNKDDALLFIRDDYLKAGKYEKALTLYEESISALVNEKEPLINRSNYQNAIDLAYVLQLNGEKDRADRLLLRLHALPARFSTTPAPAAGSAFSSGFFSGLGTPGIP